MNLVQLDSFINKIADDLDIDKEAGAYEFGARHPYVSTYWGPLAAGALAAPLGPAGSLVGLGANIGGTHLTSKGMKEERQRAGIKGKPDSFALRHPYLTTLGLPAATGLGGAAVGGAAGAGIASAAGGDDTAKLIAALMGAGILGTAGGIGGGLGAAHLLHKGQEREFRLHGKDLHKQRDEEDERKRKEKERKKREKKASAFERFSVELLDRMIKRAKDDKDKKDEKKESKDTGNTAPKKSSGGGYGAMIRTIAPLDVVGSLVSAS